MNSNNENNAHDQGTNISGTGCEILVPFEERKPLKEIELSVIKEFKKTIWNNFIKGIKEFSLVEERDKIAIGISGGKDSMLMAKLFQELKRRSHVEFELEFVAMDPGYHESIKELMIDNCKYLNIPLHIFDSRIFNIVDNIAQDYPCYMCAKMRRGALYSKAKELGCNKLALGHHFNDVIETTLLNMFYSGTFKTMLPRLKSTNFEDMELIRPMYYIKEQYIEEFTQKSGIWPLNCACMVAAKRTSSKRNEIKELIKKLKENKDDIDMSIFNAAKNVDMGAVLGWQKDKKKYSYLDFYDEE